MGVYGIPGNGKSAFTLKFCMEMAKNGPVLYDFAEQKLSGITQDVIKKLGADKVSNLYLCQYTTSRILGMH